MEQNPNFENVGASVETGGAANRFRRHMDGLVNYLQKDLGPNKIEHVRKLIRAAIHEGVQELEQLSAAREKVLKEVSSVLIRQLKEWGAQDSAYRESLNHLGVGLTNASNHDALVNCLEEVQSVTIPVVSDGLDQEQVYRQREEKYKGIKMDSVSQNPDDSQFLNRKQPS